MSLIHFHRFLIASAIVFCFAFGGWQLANLGGDGATGSLLLGFGFLTGGVILAVYLRRLRKLLRMSQPTRPADPQAGFPNG